MSTKISLNPQKHKNFFDATSVDASSTSVRLSDGNSKIGKVINLNLLSGDEILTTKNGELLTNIAGSCSGCCDGCKGNCYAINGERRYNNTAIPAHATNLAVARGDLDHFFNSVVEQLSRKRDPKYFRWHSFGEIVSYDYLLGMVNVAKKFPNIKFYFYTKRFEYIQSYLKENSFPDNLVCNISEWNGNTKGYNFEGMNKFVYDDGHDPEIAKLIHCPAVGKNGHKTGVTCEQCQRCMKRGHITAVYSH